MLCYGMLFNAVSCCVVLFCVDIRRVYVMLFCDVLYYVVLLYVVLLSNF